jgi:hypothetical protein
MDYTRILGQINLSTLGYVCFRASEPQYRGIMNRMMIDAPDRSEATIKTFLLALAQTMGFGDIECLEGHKVYALRHISDPNREIEGFECAATGKVFLKHDQLVKQGVIADDGLSACGREHAKICRNIKMLQDAADEERRKLRELSRNFRNIRYVGLVEKTTPSTPAPESKPAVKGEGVLVGFVESYNPPSLTGTIRFSNSDVCQFSVTSFYPGVSRPPCLGEQVVVTFHDGKVVAVRPLQHKLREYVDSHPYVTLVEDYSYVTLPADPKER